MLTFVLTAGLIAGVETFWRSKGHTASVSDGPEIWSWYRNEVYGDPDRTLVLVGRSRLNCGFHTERFRERFPDYKLVQLSVCGAKVLPVLRNLAEDEKFAGTVLCSIMPYDLRMSGQNGGHPYLDYYKFRNKNSESLFEHVEFGVHLQLNNLISLNDRTSLRSAWRSLYETGSLNQPDPELFQLDRSRYYDFTLVDLEKRRAATLNHNKPGKQAGPKTWMRDAEKIEPFVKRIQARGGRVVFVRYPTTGEYQKRTDIKFPKHLFWDRFAELTSAKTIHFRDVPAMCRFECPDYSHLDVRDVPQFTDILLDQLVHAQILSGDRSGRDMAAVASQNPTDTTQQMASAR